ncbi:MAG: carbohydrate kinase family protein [Leucobacter sp.]
MIARIETTAADATSRVSAGAALLIGEALIDIVEESGTSEEFVGGSPTNTAIGVARQGHTARLLTRLGRDPRGQRIAALLSAESVELLDESWTSAPTSTAHARIEADGSARYTFDLDWSLPAVSPERVDLVHAGSIGLFLEPGGSDVLRLLRELSASSLVTLDPNVRASLLPDHAVAVRRFEDAAAVADLVKLSDEDAEWLYPKQTTETILEHILALGPRVVVMTLGPAGSCAMSGASEARVAAMPVSVVDTISAGDSFMACLISCLLEQGVDGVAEALEETLRRAACASAIAVSVAGANPPLRRDLDELYASIAD